MKKIKMFSLVLVVLMVITMVQNANASDVSTKNVFDITTSGFTLDKAPQLSYVVCGFTSLDKNIPDEFAESSQYIENYSIEFFYPYDIAKQKDYTATVIKSGTIDIMDADTITIPTLEISKLGTKEIELPLIADDVKKEIASLSEQGISSVLRSISVNVFYSSPDVCELDKLDRDGHVECHTPDAMFVQKSDFAGEIGIMGSERKDFHRMYASIYAYDEYNGFGTQKRQSFNSYHSKYSAFNKLVEGMAYVSTYENDTRPDVISLGWGLGGAIGMYDSSISFQGGYNLQCEHCMLDGRTKYAYNNFTKSSSKVSMHDTLFTGQSVGYNIPDVGIGNCEYCGSDIGTRPAVLNINAKSGWYNRGGYDGANGTARTEYNHTYTGRTLTITPSVSYPWNISFTPNLVENKDFEKTWVYVTISPN